MGGEKGGGLMYSCGMPVMKLDRQNHFGKKSERSGNARAIVKEAWEERQSSDSDLDRSLTPDNIYFGFRSGEKLADYWEQLADDYRVTDKHGKQRKLRADAGIGFAGIIKPEKAYMDKLTRQQQEAFFRDALGVVSKIYASEGLKIDAAVIQVDEGCTHMHYAGHDPDYQLGKKLGLPLFYRLNREFPEKMREKGWAIKNLTGYPEATAGKTEAEKTAYKRKRRAERRKHGRSSSEYKASKDREAAERARQEAQETLQKAQETLQKAQELAKQATGVQDIREAQETVQRRYRGLQRANQKSGPFLPSKQRRSDLELGD